MGILTRFALELSGYWKTDLRCARATLRPARPQPWRKVRLHRSSIRSLFCDAAAMPARSCSVFVKTCNIACYLHNASESTRVGRMYTPKAALLRRPQCGGTRYQHSKGHWPNLQVRDVLFKLDLSRECDPPPLCNRCLPTVPTPRWTSSANASKVWSTLANLLFFFTKSTSSL